MDVDVLQSAPPASSPAATARKAVPVAIAALALCCLLWGLSFPIAQKATLLVEHAVGDRPDAPWLNIALRPTYNGWRFSLAALIYLLVTFRSQRRFSRADRHGGLVTGLFFTAGVFLQLLGLRYTVPSVSAFLTALAVVFAPLAQAFLLRRKVSGRIWFSVLLALAGTLLLSYPASGGAGATLAQVPPVPYLGEILTTLGSLMFTAQILALDHYGKDANPIRLTFIMFATAGLGGLATGLVMSGTRLYDGAILSKLLPSLDFWWTILCLAIICSAVAMHLMNRFQPLIAPAIATVIYCLEPVFGTGFSVALGTESLTLHTLVGGAIIIAAVIAITRGSEG